MRLKQYVLYKAGGRTVHGISYGKLVEVRYIDTVRTDIASPDPAEFERLLRQSQFSDADLEDCRIGYVDENGVGNYTSWQEFLDSQPEAAAPVA